VRDAGQVLVVPIMCLGEYAEAAFRIRSCSVIGSGRLEYIGLE